MTQLAHLMTSRPAGLRCVQPLLFREDETCLGVDVVPCGYVSR
jgi:hypothetical protein